MAKFKRRPQCRGCTIRTIDFTETGWESQASSAGTLTQTASGITFEPGVTLTLTSGLANSLAPFEMQLTAETASNANLLKFRVLIYEDDVLAETIYVEGATAGEIASAAPSDTYIRKVRLDSNDDSYWDRSGDADPADIIENKMRLAVASDQYWVGDWSHDLLEPSVPNTGLIIEGDDRGFGFTGHIGSTDAIISSPRTAGSVVKFAIVNDSSVDLKVSQIEFVKLDSPEQDLSDRSTCKALPISCPATADNRQMRWTDIRVTMPDTTVFSLLFNRDECTSSGQFTADTYDSFDEYQLWYYPISGSGDTPIPLEFDGIQYGVIGANGTVQETEDPDELLLSVTVGFHMLSAAKVNGFSAGSQGYEASEVSVEILYEKTIPKPAAFTAPADVTLTSADIVSSTIIAGPQSAIATETTVLSSLHHGTGTGTNTGLEVKIWQPGITWSDFGGPTGKAIEGTSVAVDEDFINAVEVTFGQHIP